MVLGDVAAGLRVQQFDAEFQPARQHGDFQWLQVQHAQFGDDAQAAQLRHQQQLAIGIEEHPLHRAVGTVVIDADTRRLLRSRVGHHGHQAVDEIGGLAWNLQGAPAQAVGGDLTQGAACQLARKLGESRVLGRGLDAVHPGTPGFAAGHGEGGAGKQFGVQAIRGFLRGVLADGQRPWQGLAGKFVAEARLVAEGRRRRIEVHGASWKLE